MSNHYEDSLTPEEYELQFEATPSIEVKTYVEAYSEVLSDYIPTGIGKDALEAREDLLERLDGLLNELETEKAKILYGDIDLEYTTVKSL